VRGIAGIEWTALMVIPKKRKYPPYGLLRHSTLSCSPPLITYFLYVNLNTDTAVKGAGAAIQRRGSILAWIVILSVYGADTIAIDISLSALIS
jgi:hypothetical protein